MGQPFARGPAAQRLIAHVLMRRARQDRLAEPGLQHSPPGDTGTARRGMKTVESSAVFQPKQWAEKEARKTIENKPNPNLCPRTLFEVPLSVGRATRTC
jgi:hypothetical protein